MKSLSQPLVDTRRPVIIDTDLSFDDYVALLYLLQHPAIEVRAITVANGVVHVKPGVENARRLLALVNQLDIPIAGGPDVPFAGQNDFPASWRLMLDYGIRFFLPLKKAPASSLDAPELIRHQILASEVPITIIALAPLTNLALAFRQDPTLATRIETIVVSGGALDVPGTIHTDVPANPNMVSEWNLYLDPVAADIVFRSGARIALVPLDVTHVHGSQPLLFRREFIQILRAAAKGKASKLLVRLIHFWQLSTPQYQATPVWDGAVAAIAANPGLGKKWAELGLKIVLQPKSVAGQTIIDENEPTRIQVCLAGDQTAFEATYLAIVKGDNEVVHKT